MGPTWVMFAPGGPHAGPMNFAIRVILYSQYHGYWWPGNESSHGISRMVYSDFGARKVNAWRRHQMETFSALLAICAGNSPVTDEFPAQRPVTRSFDVFFDLRLNNRLSKHSWGWWFETLSRPLWRHCNCVSLASNVWCFTCTTTCPEWSTQCK